MRKILLAISIIILYGIKLYAQDEFIKEIKLTPLAGFKDVRVGRHPINENADIMNYIYANQNKREYYYWGLALNLKILEKIKLDFSSTIFGTSDKPNSFSLSLQYYYQKQKGINIGAFSFTQNLNRLSEYHVPSALNVDFYDISLLPKKNTPIDYGMYCGAIFVKEKGIATLRYSINIGLSNISPFSESVFQKQINGNIRREIKYETIQNFELFLLPKTELDIHLFRIKRNKFGIQLQSNLYLMAKSINYNRTIYEWTHENYSIEEVTNRKHYYRKFEFNFGLYMKWY